MAHGKTPALQFISSILLGLLLGVIIYQSSKIDVGLDDINSTRVFADSAISDYDPCDPSGDPYEYCVCQTGDPSNCGGASSSSFGCTTGQITCGATCCDFDTQYCQPSTESCIDRTPSSSSFSSFSTSSSEPSSSSSDSSDPCASSASA